VSQVSRTIGRRPACERTDVKPSLLARRLRDVARLDALAELREQRRRQKR